MSSRRTPPNRAIARTFVAAAVCIGITAAAAGQKGEPAEPADYRAKDYRAPVPATLQGARVVETTAAHDLWRAGETVFIDVLPRTPRPKLPAGTVWREKPHRDIPGSTWLANVGYGPLSGELDAWYRKRLGELTGGDRTRPILLYCLSDCWMSWNAARRALEYGYADVIWYPDGIDGWSAAGLPLEEREPEWPADTVGSTARPSR